MSFKTPYVVLISVVYNNFKSMSRVFGKLTIFLYFFSKLTIFYIFMLYFSYIYIIKGLRMSKSRELAKYFDLCQHHIEGRHDGYHSSDYLSSKYFERYFTGAMPVSKEFIMTNFSHINMTSVVQYDEGMLIGKVINNKYQVVIYSWRGEFYVSPILTLQANILKLDLSGLEKIHLKEIK